jgi:hypothetical protein
MQQQQTTAAEKATTGAGHLTGNWQKCKTPRKIIDTYQQLQKAYPSTQTAVNIGLCSYSLYPVQVTSGSARRCRVHSLMRNSINDRTLWNRFLVVI